MDVIENLKDNIDNSQFLITEGLGHSRILKDKEVIEKIVKFVENWKDT